MKRIFWATALLLAIPMLAHANCVESLWICKLKPYEPNPNLGNTNNTSPECDGPATSGDVKKIKDAYDAIPNTLSKVKNDLCQVKHIFVTSTASHSWARYNDPSVHPNDNPGASYIAITRSALNKHFALKQDEHLRGLSPKGSAGVFHTSSGSNSRNVKFGLMYSLAHELAHIKWHQQYPLSGSQLGIPCYDSIFGPSWQSTAAAKMNRWTEFGKDNVGTHPGIPNPKNASSDQLYKIYNSGFATALAAANPEEDFVESYALGVVNAACTGCLFSLNSSSGKTTLSNRPPVDAKIACVAQNYF